MKTLEQRKHYIHTSNDATNMRVNVLHIIKSLGRGGAETLLAETLNLHDKVRYNFHYLYFLPWKDQMVKEIRQHGGKVECKPATSTIRIFLKLRTLIRYIRENNIDIIHCHMPVAGVIGRICGRITGVPVIYTEHNKWERYHKVTYYLNKFTFGLQKMVLAVSSEVKASIQKHYNRNVPELKILLNGVDTTRFCRHDGAGKEVRELFGIPENAIVIGTACVFRQQKRLTKWIEIAAALRKKDERLYFIIAGDGVLRDEVHAKAKELRTERYLFFAGMQAQVRPYIEAMDIFMMTSEFEGLPIALLEAMSMQCIPACTAAGGIGDVVQNDVNGILVPVAQPELLVDSILACISDDGLMRKLKARARATIKSGFEMTTMVKHLEDIYSSVNNSKN